MTDTFDFEVAPGPETFDRLEADQPMTVGSARAAARGGPYSAVKNAGVGGRGASPYRSMPDSAIKKVVVGDPSVRASAELLGFTWLGCYQFTPPRGHLHVREAWVDPRGCVRLSLRRAQTSDRVERKMALYLLSTTFDDGFEITTWSSRLPTLLSTERIDERAGEGDLDADYASHMDAVRARASSGHRPLTLPDLATVIRAGHWDHFHLRPGRRGHGRISTKQRVWYSVGRFGDAATKLVLVAGALVVLYRIYKWLLLAIGHGA